MERIEKIPIAPRHLPAVDQDDRQVAILKLWEAFDLVDDEPAKQLIAFAIDRLVAN